MWCAGMELRHLCVLSYTPSLYTQFSLQNYLTQQTFNVIVKRRVSGLGCLVLSDARLQNERLTRPVYVHVDHPSTPLAARKMTLGGTQRVTFIYLFIDWLICFSKDRISLSLGWTRKLLHNEDDLQVWILLPLPPEYRVCRCMPHSWSMWCWESNTGFTNARLTILPPLGCIPCSI